MKHLHKPRLFLLIWLLHILVYYSIYLIVLRILKNDYEAFYTVLGGAIGGLIGWLEQIPFFILIPISIMLALINSFLKKKWFEAYLIAILTAYLADYIWLFSEDKNNGVLLSTIDIDLIYLIIPSLLISILSNWLIFKRYYKAIASL
ncbi:hypothetical protein [Sphingobacterium sp. BIGb0165]|uniref:hypothetical protein n=1 Tax=Sphingobacterium sp. BIGb0165 TaxID=2940615 RepID=UPI00216A1BC5|nr:hypothetical protein [Sphingobacterium sp. BIGb0165]MCS4229180.1 hypothetical protein [Sphingobacterium sp. BIGb0165]